MNLERLLRDWRRWRGATLLEPRRSDWHLRLTFELPFVSPLGCPGLVYHRAALVNCRDLILHDDAGCRFLSTQELAEREPRLGETSLTGDRLVTECRLADGGGGRLVFRARELVVYDQRGEPLDERGVENLPAAYRAGPPT
jgi:hypothetical protein